MAGREKKPALSKKQTPSPVPPKEGAAPLENVATEVKDTPSTQTTTTRRKAIAKRAIKKRLRVGFKPAKKKPALKLSKTIFNVAQASLDSKKAALIKNGISAPKRVRKPKNQTVPAPKIVIKQEPDDEPPVLEPMEPLPSENGLPAEKKELKKRAGKKTATTPPEIQDENKPTLDLEGSVETSSNASEPIIANDATTKKPLKKGKTAKKVTKEEPMETLDDVMNDLSEHMNADTSDILKTKKVATRKTKVDSPKRKAIKKENLILHKDLSNDSSVTKVIDMLDLNVSKRPKKQLTKKRRHSIEKFPTTPTEVSDSTAITAFQLFPNTPRSVSPRSKRGSRIRQSIDATISTRRSSPYTTRSDSPARILRNGKQRKLKDFLLDGIELHQKRRRLCSDLSGSELSVSRNSGFESDTSSYSDLAPPLDNAADVSETVQNKPENATKGSDMKKELLEAITKNPNYQPPEELRNLDIKSISTKFTAILKRSLSTEAKLEKKLEMEAAAAANGNSESPEEHPPNIADENNITDTNSNLCTDVKPDITKITSNIPMKAETADDTSDNQNVNIKLCPESKVPEKNFILDIMKQTFNDVEEQEKERRPTRSSARIKKTTDKAEEKTTPTKSEEKTPTKSEEKPSTAATKVEEKAVLKPEDKTVVKSQEKAAATAVSDEKSAVMTPEKVVSKTEEKSISEPEEEAVEEVSEKANEVEENPIPPPEEKVEPETKEDLSVKVAETIADDSTEKKSDLAMSAKKFYGAPVNNDTNSSEAIPTQAANDDKVKPEKDGKEETDDLLKPECNEVEKVVIEVEEKEMDKIDVSSHKSEESEALIEIEEVESKSELQSEMLMKALVAETAEYVEKTLLNNSLISSQGDTKLVVDNLLVANTNGDKENHEEKMDVDDAADAVNVANIAKVIAEESEENLAKKENILQALGLQSLKAAAEAKLREKVVPKHESYTGTLKTVIKLNRGMEKKRRRNSLKMTIQKKGKSKDGSSEACEDEANYRISKESGSGPWRHHGTHSSDTAGAHRKTHYSNRSNLDGSSEHTSDGDTATGEVEGTAKALVIPEKASSFSVHPGRLCKDECCYCFGKFGLFDTPCHIAQMKSVERQDKILATEVHLTRDSCLCDACYRHVDRKSNTPFYNKQLKKANMIAPAPRINHCHVLGCDQVSSNILKRKWLIKMRKSVSKVINIDLDNPGLHSIPVCETHYASLEHLMVCAMCKRRLARNHIHYLGPECTTLNKALDAEGIPVTLVDKPVVCKLCRLFSSILLKPEDNNENKVHFFNEYKRRLLHFHNIELMDEAEAEEPIAFPSKDRPESKEKVEKEPVGKRRRTKLAKSQLSGPPVLEPQIDLNRKPDQDRVPFEGNTDQSRSESPSDYMVDYGALTPNITMECGGSDVELMTKQREVPKKQQQQQHFLKKSITSFADMKQLKAVTLVKGGKSSAVQRLGSNSSISVRQLFPGEEDLPLQGNVDFNTVKERTPEGWEKCNCTIQYDLNTKHLWHELQKPYGNQSSFLRHLILLEKYFRNGDLVLSPNASHHSINYSESVQNRLRAYDNISTSTPLQQISMLPINQSPIKKSSSGIVTTNKEPSVTPKFTMINAANIPKNTPITLSQISSLTPVTLKSKPSSVPPGLISLQPGTIKPVAPVVKVPQKIKFPIGKNWKPTLRPVDQTNMTSTGEKKRISGVVQVIAGGKPYHISLEDYNRMCSLQKNQERNQKQGDARHVPASATAATVGGLLQHNSLLKTNLLSGKKKLTVTSKTLANLNIKPAASAADPDLVVSENKLEGKLLEAAKGSEKPTSMHLPKIPKSLTVIPQTVSRKSRPSSPVLSITTKPKAPTAAAGKS